MKNRIEFNRNELSGSFGDIGTDFPLIIGMILASNLDVASVFVMFGLMQILTGVVYGLPMPMQPLKAMAVFGDRPTHSIFRIVRRGICHWPGDVDLDFERYL